LSKSCWEKIWGNFPFAHCTTYPSKRRLTFEAPNLESKMILTWFSFYNRERYLLTWKSQWFFAYEEIVVVYSKTLVKWAIAIEHLASHRFVAICNMYHNFASGLKHTLTKANNYLLGKQIQVSIETSKHQSSWSEHSSASYVACGVTYLPCIHHIYG
jgi:hypothetical protein